MSPRRYTLPDEDPGALVHRRRRPALAAAAAPPRQRQGVSPSGGHTANTSVPQAWFTRQEGVTRLSTETGAGRWGSALAVACRLYGLERTVHMVRASYDQKPHRRSMIRTWGADVVASPSPDTAAGRGIPETTPDSTGSLGIAISEAVEDAATREDTRYAPGSVPNHVLLHQTIVGQEAREQPAPAPEPSHAIRAVVEEVARAELGRLPALP